MKRDPALVSAIATLWLALGVFVLYPFARLLQVTFFADGYFSLASLERVFTNWYDRAAVFNSLYLAFAVALAGVLLGFIFAFAVTRMNLPRPVKWFLGAIPVLPLISPPFTSSIAITLALGPNGMFFRWFGLPEFTIYGFWGTWLSETLTVFPVAFLTLSAVLAAIDPNLEDASLSLGRSRLGTFVSVTLPLTTPGLANAFLCLPVHWPTLPHR
jgi:iron(III) transport system permease protein